VSHINVECIINKSGSLTQQHACRQTTTNAAAATNALKYAAAAVETIITIAIVCVWHQIYRLLCWPEAMTSL